MNSFEHIAPIVLFIHRMYVCCLNANGLISLNHDTYVGKSTFFVAAAYLVPYGDHILFQEIRKKLIKHLLVL